MYNSNQKLTFNKRMENETNSSFVSAQVQGVFPVAAKAVRHFIYISFLKQIKSVSYYLIMSVPRFHYAL